MTGKSLVGDLRRGDETQVLLKLQQGGVLPDDYAAIAYNDALCADVIAAINKHCLFATPTEQIQRFLEINEAVWKDLSITEAVIRELGDPSECPTSDENGLYCVNLFRETGDAVQTFSDNWDACVHVHGEDGTWKWGGLIFTQQGVRQRASAITRPTGLRWQVAELGRQFQRWLVEQVCPQLDSTQIMGMGQELPFIAALHKKWVTSMDGGKIPFVDAPDLEVALRGRGEFSNAPFLFFNSDDRQVCLNSGHIGNVNSVFGSGSLR